MSPSHGRRVASPVEYASCFAEKLFDKEEALLKAHALGGEMSMSDLAPAAGYDDYQPVNLAYGRIGRRLAEALDLTPPTRADGSPIRFAVLAAWRDEARAPGRVNDPIPPYGASFRSYLHEEVIRGLHLHGVLSDQDLQVALEKRASVFADREVGTNRKRTAARNTALPSPGPDASIVAMIQSVRTTTKYANGQMEERRVKNKDLKMSIQDLEKTIRRLIEDQKGTCKLSGLPLQFHGTGHDRQMLPSLDRIDSNGHYEPGNLQVVCRFINDWKSNTEDDEFRRLLAMVQRQNEE